MIEYGLPKTVTVDGVEKRVVEDGDYRAILDVISALNDKDLPEQARYYLALRIFYKDDLPQDLTAAMRAMSEFIAGGEQQARQSQENGTEAALMDWEHDFYLIASAIQKTNGTDVRGVAYLHWWSFLAMYMEIDEHTTFSFIVCIRKKLSHGKKLDDNEREFLNKNRKTVILNYAGDDEWLAEDF